jgi:hypothetical protein
VEGQKGRRGEREKGRKGEKANSRVKLPAGAVKATNYFLN